MGKFLRDSQGNLVTIGGGLVLVRTLDRKPRDCEQCGFSKWAKKDKVFIIQGGSGIGSPKGDNKGSGSAGVLGGYAGGGSMEWICPDCALKRGLPVEFYHKNFFSPGNAEARKKEQEKREKQKKKNQSDNGGVSSVDRILDNIGSLCRPF